MKTASRFTLAAVASSVLCGLPHPLPGTAAQTPPDRKPAEIQSPAPARVETTEVLVDVIVTDRRGRAVTDLRPEEFTVLEDGVAQPIRSIWLEVQPDATLSGGPDQPPPVAAPEGVTLHRSTTPGMITILFDSLSLSRSSRLLAIKAARDVLQQMPVNTPVAVFVLDRRLTLLYPLQGDRKGLLKALDQLSEGRSRPYASNSAELERIIEASGQRSTELVAQSIVAGTSPATTEVSAAAINAILLNTLRQFETYEKDLQAQMSVVGLLSVVRSLQSLPGRKSVVLVSEGFAVPENVSRQYQTVIRSANRSNVAFYTIDAAGLRLEGDGESASRELSAIGAARGNQRSDPSLVQDGRSAMGRAEDLARDSRVGVLTELADSTGGLPARNSNDLREAFGRVRSDLSAYYLLSYRPTNTRMDGSFRSIQVRVSRPDVRVRGRSGYDAVPGGNVGPQLDYEPPLWRALLSELTPEEIPLEPVVWRFPAGARNDWLLLAALVPLSAVQLSPVPAEQAKRDRKAEPAEGFVGGRLDFMAVVQDGRQQVLGKKSQSSDLLLASSKVESARNATVNMQRTIGIFAMPADVSIVVRDAGSGKVSVKRQNTRPLADDGATPKLSSVIPVQGVERAAAGDLADDPMIYSGSRILPNFTRRFSKAADSQMRFYFVTLADPGAAARAKVEFLQAGQVVAQAPGDLPAADSRGFIRFLSEFPVEPFPPGEYTVRITVEQAGRKASQQTAFTIVP